MTKAVLNGDRIECGKCGALLAKRVQGFTCISKSDTEHSDGTLEIKCKHKDKGTCCNEVNRIEL